MGDPIPISLAASLYDAGYSWREVADFIAARTGRRYQAVSIFNAVRRGDRAG